MKNDLISRAALIETFERFINQPDTQPLVRAFMTSVICVTENAPTVDAEPVRHGRWKRDPEDRNYFICSSCGIFNGEWHEFADCTHKFCPWCGAKMDLEEGVVDVL